MKQFILFFSFLFVLSHQFASGQILATHSTMSDMVLCETQTATITISNNGNFTSSDEIYIVFPNSSSPVYSNFLAIGANITMLSDTVRIDNLPSLSSIDLTYTTTISCDGLNISSYSQSNSYDFSLNETNWATQTSNSYNVNSPFINDLGGMQLNYGYALLGTGTTRTFFYTNTNGLVPFSGFVEFRDTLPHALANSSVTFDTVFLASNNATLVNYEITDSTVSILVEINSLLLGDTLKISDVLSLNECVVGQNNVTKYELKYGCVSTDLCQEVPVEFVSFQTTLNFDPNDKPHITVLNLDQHHESCYNDTVTRIEKFINTGIGLASSFQAHLVDNLNATGLTFLDTSTISIYLNTISAATEMSRTITLAAADSYVIVTDQGVSSGDTIILLYNETNKCVSQAEYDNYFNSTISIHDISGKAKFNHPCNPTNHVNIGTHLASLHLYQINQQFNNMTGMVTDTEVTWFEIENQNDVLFGGDSYSLNGDEIGYDITNSQIEVEFIVESGLSFTDVDSISFTSNFGGVTVSLPLVQSTLLWGAPGTNQYDTIRAFYELPSSFQTPNTYGHNPFKKTSDFYEFFSNSSIRFQTQAHCDSVAGDGKSLIRENIYFIIDTNCADCKLPLGSVESEINIICPGCILPGWNLTSMDVKRINFGYADQNNDHYPDSFNLQPADTNFAKTNNVIIGDTLEFNIEGFITNGDPTTGYTFANIGFSYDEGQMLFVGDISKLKFVGGTGYFSQSGVTTFFTVPAGVETVYPNGISIGMDSVSMQSYGLPFNSYDETCTIIFNPRFKVIDNFDDGLGANPYFDLKGVTCFYNMSGTLLGDPNLLPPDANIIPMTTIDTMTNTERSNLNYWCVAYEGRFIGVGVDFVMNPAFMMKTYGQGTTITGGCQYRISESMFGLIGDEVIQGGVLTNSPLTNSQAVSQTSATAFSYELRDLFNLDSIRLEIPVGLELSEIKFGSYSYVINTVYQSQWTSQNFENASGPSPFYAINGTTLTVYPEEFIHQNTNYVSGDNNLSYDENSFIAPQIFLRNSSCPVGGTTIPIASLDIENYFSNFPGATNGDTLITVTMNNASVNQGVGPVGEINSPDPQFIIGTNQVQPAVGFNFGQEIDFSVFVPLPYNNPNYLIGHTIDVAYNSFMMFESPNGNFTNITVPNVDNITTNYNTLVSSTVSGPPTYTTTTAGELLVETGTLGGYMAYSQSRKLDLLANHDCSNVAPGGIDSLYIIYGWNCFDYPDTLDNTCFLDTFVLYLTTPNTGLGVQYGIQNPVSLCDTIHLSAEFNAVGIGEVNNIAVEIFDQNNQVIEYLPGSGLVSYDGSDYPVDPTATGTSELWILDSIITALEDYNGLSPNAMFTADLLTGCGVTSDDSLLIRMSGTNYCGQLIFEDTFELTPQIFFDLPLLDSLELTSSGGTFISCDDTSTISLNVSNLGIATSDVYNQVLLVIPPGYQYISGGLPTYNSNDTLILPISVGVNAGSSTSIDIEIAKTSNSCDGETIDAQLILRSPYYCDTNECFYTSIQTLILEIPLENNPNGFNIWTVDPTGLCFGNNQLILDFSSLQNGTIEVFNANTMLSLGQANYPNSMGVIGQFIIPLSDSSSNLFFVNSGLCCSDTIYYNYSCDTLCISPQINQPTDVIVCESFTLQPITGANLSGDQAYYNNSQQMGGSLITASAITSTQTVWIYDSSGICFDEVSFNVIVNQMPQIDQPLDTTACDIFVLGPITGTNLSGNQGYYNNSQAMGGTILTSLYITTSQTVWIYDSNDPCSEELSFNVTIVSTSVLLHEKIAQCGPFVIPEGLGAGITIDSTGVYVFSSVPPNCIQEVWDITIWDIPIPIINGVVDVDCYGNCNGSIDLTVPGNGTYEFEINNTTGTYQDVNNNGYFTGLCAGSYIIDIVDLDFGCDTTITLDILEPAALTIDSVDITHCCDGGDDCNGSIDISVSGGTGPYTYSWSNGHTTQDLSFVNPGNYTVTIQTANGCSISQSYTIIDLHPLSNSGSCFYIKETNCVYDFLNLFNDLSATNPNVTTTVVWTINDGSGNPPVVIGNTWDINNYVFPTNINYEICVTVTNSIDGQDCSYECCQVINSCFIDCEEEINANFVYTSTGPNSYSFTNISSSNGGTPSGYIVWTWGDGTTSSFNVNNPPQSYSHTYQSPGIYDVCLTVDYIFDNGTKCSETICKTIVHCGKYEPCANLSFFSYQNNSSYNSYFNATVLPSSFNVTSYQWYFGIPGAYGTGQSPVYNYPPVSQGATSDTYLVTLIVHGLDAEGNKCSTCITKQISISKIDKEPYFKNAIIIPNPNNGKFTIRFDDDNKVDKLNILVRNTFGAIVYKKTESNVSTVRMNLTSLESGVYMVELMNDEFSITKRVVIVK